ncbi:hypothetical protein ACFL21_05345, partial [Patescibacteria group bacterium]
ADMEVHLISVITKLRINRIGSTIVESFESDGSAETSEDPMYSHVLSLIDPNDLPETMTQLFQRTHVKGDYYLEICNKLMAQMGVTEQEFKEKLSIPESFWKHLKEFPQENVGIQELDYLKRLYKEQNLSRYPRLDFDDSFSAQEREVVQEVLNGFGGIRFVSIITINGKAVDMFSGKDLYDVDYIREFSQFMVSLKISDSQFQKFEDHGASISEDSQNYNKAIGLWLNGFRGNYIGQMYMANLLIIHNFLFGSIGDQHQNIFTILNSGNNPANEFTHFIQSAHYTEAGEATSLNFLYFRDLYGEEIYKQYLEDVVKAIILRFKASESKISKALGENFEINQEFNNPFGLKSTFFESIEGMMMEPPNGEDLETLKLSHIDQVAIYSHYKDQIVNGISEIIEGTGSSSQWRTKELKKYWLKMSKLFSSISNADRYLEFHSIFPFIKKSSDRKQFIREYLFKFILEDPKGVGFIKLFHMVEGGDKDFTDVLFDLINKNKRIQNFVIKLTKSISPQSAAYALRILGLFIEKHPHKKSEFIQKILNYLIRDLADTQSDEVVMKLFIFVSAFSNRRKVIKEIIKNYLKNDAFKKACDVFGLPDLPDFHDTTGIRGFVNDLQTYVILAKAFDSEDIHKALIDVMASQEESIDLSNLLKDIHYDEDLDVDFMLQEIRIKKSWAPLDRRWLLDKNCDSVMDFDVAFEPHLSNSALDSWRVFIRLPETSESYDEFVILEFEEGELVDIVNAESLSKSQKNELKKLGVYLAYQFFVRKEGSSADLPLKQPVNGDPVPDPEEQENEDSNSDDEDTEDNPEQEDEEDEEIEDPQDRSTGTRKQHPILVQAFDPEKEKQEQEEYEQKAKEEEQKLSSQMERSGKIIRKLVEGDVEDVNFAEVFVFRRLVSSSERKGKYVFELLKPKEVMTHTLEGTLIGSELYVQVRTPALVQCPYKRFTKPGDNGISYVKRCRASEDAKEAKDFHDIEDRLPKLGALREFRTPIHIEVRDQEFEVKQDEDLVEISWGANTELLLAMNNGQFWIDYYEAKAREILSDIRQIENQFESTQNNPQLQEEVDKIMAKKDLFLDKKRTELVDKYWPKSVFDHKSSESLLSIIEYFEIF